MTFEAWQVALRREFGREQKFRLQQEDRRSIFSAYWVTNPQTKRTYRVAIRGQEQGCNFCTCPDYAVNTLGTCKHIEFVLGKIEKTKTGRKALAVGFRPKFSEVYLRYGSKREVVFSRGGECPPQVLRLAKRYFDENGLLRESRYGDFERFLKDAGASGHEIRCYDDALSFVAQVRDRERLAERIRKLFSQGANSPTFKRLLKVPLYRYQREGALFCARAGRSLLADDMGLGKTIQAIAAAEILTKAVGIEKALVVCPTSVKHQWKQEIEKFSGRSAVVVEGLRAPRERKFAADSFFKIVNYDVIPTDQDLIRHWGPDLVILDEAQRIKNWKTRRARAVKEIESEHAIVLTGTPIENRIEELHSIMEFVDRHRLGPLFRFLATHQRTDEHGKVTGYKDLDAITRTLAPVLLRRRKDEVLKSLPERIEKRLFVPMTEEQWRHHDENRNLVARIVHKWRRFGFLSDRDQRLLMIALQNMRMACNSTYLLDKQTDFGLKADEVMTVLKDVLERPESKVVIFSQWLGTHELLCNRLRERKWDHVLFHGGLTSMRRRQLVQQFREESRCRLFLSTDAGGVGLNLQHADTVVNMDIPWNPAVLEQRIGRVHRLGQVNPVRVVHFVAQGTIEHGMLDVLAFKASLFSGVLDGGQSEVFLGGTRLKRFMESVEKVTGSIPVAMPAQTAAAGDEATTEQEDTSIMSEKVTATSSHPDSEASKERSDDTKREEAKSEAAIADVASAGLAFFDKLASLIAPGVGTESNTPTATAVPAISLERDPAGGRPYLRLPLPDPKTLEQLRGWLAGLAALAGQVPMPRQVL